ncbi:uncharacterized protein GGS25DRAFT_479526, partial [Hypoxylon fragiforme]|uniref:uncharacterized protein n=1 Tax=Hypoxylon fragiforme TaxID=63214 RepID=UPI0020C60786
MRYDAMREAVVVMFLWLVLHTYTHPDTIERLGASGYFCPFSSSSYSASSWVGLGGFVSCVYMLVYIPRYILYYIIYFYG